MKINVLVSAVKTSFLKLIYHRAGAVVHLLLLKFYMIRMYFRERKAYLF